MSQENHLQASLPEEIPIRPVKMTFDETVAGIKGINYEKWGNWEARGYLLDTLGGFYDASWRGELGPFVVDLANIDCLSAQRFLEHASNDIKRNPNFDIGKYGKTTLTIYKDHGINVGNYYTWSYSAAINSGMTPEQYYSLIQKAAKNGGRMFAAWIAFATEEVVNNGGNAQEFEETALKIRKKGGAKLIKPLTQNAGEITLARRQEVFFQDFEELALNTIDTLGKDATYWLLRALPTLVAKHKVNPFDFVHDMEEIAAKYGEVTVKQYLGGLCKNLKTLGDAKEEEAQERLDTARNAYQELIDACGKTASSFFAFRGLDLSSTASLQINQKSIALFKRTVKPKVFHTTAWFGSKIEMLELTTLLGLITTYAEKQGTDQTVKELQYAAGAIRKGCFVAYFPISHSTKYDYGASDFDEETRGEWEYEDISGIEGEINLKEGQQARLF